MFLRNIKSLFAFLESAEGKRPILPSEGEPHAIVSYDLTCELKTFKTLHLLCIFPKKSSGFKKRVQAKKGESPITPTFTTPRLTYMSPSI